MRLKSSAGRISIHGNLEDDKNLYRELLPARLAAPFQRLTSFGITEAAQLGRVLGIGARLIELSLGEALYSSQLRASEVCFRQVHAGQIRSSVIDACRSSRRSRPAVLSRSTSPRVVGTSSTAFARKARASAARSFSGRPRQPPLLGQRLLHPYQFHHPDQPLVALAKGTQGLLQPGEQLPLKPEPVS